MTRARVGIATKLLGWGGTLVVAAALWGILFDPAIDTALSTADNQTTMTEANTSIGYVQDAATWMPLWVLLILFVGMVGVAVFRSRRAP